MGVTAFHGAIPAIKDKQNLELLAGIAPVEAYHAAILRTLLYQKGLEMVTPYNIRVFDFVQVRAQGALSLHCGILHELFPPCVNLNKCHKIHDCMQSSPVPLCHGKSG